MSLRRSAATLLLVGLLFTALVGANVTVAAEQTVLSDEYVSDRLADSNASAAATDVILERAGGVRGVAADEALEGAVEGYLDAQTDELVSELYAYLHGDSEELALSVPTEPLIENLSAAAERTVREGDPIDLYRNYSSGSLEESIDGPTPVTADQLARMDDNATAYESVRSDLRADLRDRVIAEMVDELYAEATTDELLALVVDDYDPTADTDAEKEQLLEEHDTEIRAALETRVRESDADEIDRRVDDRLAEWADSVTVEDDPENVTAAGQALGKTYAVGIAGEQSSATFADDIQTAQAALATAVGDRVASDLRAELPAEVSVTEPLSAEQRSQLETVATGIQLLDVLVFVFPVVAIAAVGLLYLLHGSGGRTARIAGLTIGVAGLLAVVGTAVGRSLLGDRLGALPEPIGGLLESIVLGAIGQLSAQSLWLLAAGLALVGLSVLLGRRSTDSVELPT